MGYYCLRLVLKSTKNNVTTLTMNNPKKLNGWSGPMMLTLKDRFVSAHGQFQTQAHGAMVKQVMNMLNHPCDNVDLIFK